MAPKISAEQNCIENLPIKQLILFSSILIWQEEREYYQLVLDIRRVT